MKILRSVDIHLVAGASARTIRISERSTWIHKNPTLMVFFILSDEIIGSTLIHDGRFNGIHSYFQSKSNTKTTSMLPTIPQFRYNFLE